MKGLVLLVLMLFPLTGYLQDFQVNMNCPSPPCALTPPIQPIGTYYIGDTSFSFAIGAVNQVGSVSYTYNISLLQAASGLTVNVPSGFVDPSVPAGWVEVVHNPTAGTVSEGTYTFILQVSDQRTPTQTDSFQEFSIEVVRRPVSVVMVLDRSGSMGWDLATNNQVSAPNRRWDKLVQGVDLFGDQLASPGIAVPEDQIGVVYFESEPPATAQASGASFNNGFFVGSFGDLGTTVGAEAPGGWTSMGEGLDIARNMLQSPNVPTLNRKVILLFTDGEQNKGRLVDPNGQVLDDGTPINPGDFEIYPIAINGTGSYPAVLQAIANNNNDDNVALFTPGVPDPDGAGSAFQDISLFFVNTLNTILQDSSPQLIEHKAGTTDVNGRAMETFTVNDSIAQLFFYTVTGNRTSMKIKMVKDGVEVPATRITNGTGTSLYAVDFPVTTSGGFPMGISPKGAWEVQLAGSKNSKYTVGAIVNDHKLHVRYNLSTTNKVEDTLKATVRLDYHGLPITDAGTVIWTVLKPGTDIGHLMAEATAEFDASGAVDSGSAGLQKYFYLLENDPDFVNALQASGQVIPLTNNGDGTYTGSFADTDVTGVYESIFYIKGDHPDIGTYVRSNFRSTNFRFNTIDNDLSTLGTQLIAGGIILNYRPAYQVGGQLRYLGPAFANSIRVSGSGISVQSITDQADGSYSITLNGNPDSDIAVSILGDEVYNGKASSFGKPEGIWGKIKDWVQNTLGIPFWLFLVILILILLILWILRKVFS